MQAINGMVHPVKYTNSMQVYHNNTGGPPQEHFLGFHQESALMGLLPACFTVMQPARRRCRWPLLLAAAVLIVQR